jgi:hypothetical protein
MRTIFILLSCVALLVAAAAFATQISVHYQEGVTHGYLMLRDPGGRLLADGENSQIASGSTLRSRLTFRFKDGSLYDDTTVYTERGVFRLVSDHAIQKGPSFKSQQETYIDTSTGAVSVKYLDKGKWKFIRRKMKLPPDVSNGLLYIIVKNIAPSPAATVSYLAFTPQPRLVRLAFIRSGESRFLTDSVSHKAIHYVMKVEIGGVTGVVASILKKVPPDTQFWLLDGTPPAFAGSEGPLYGDGPVWRVDLVSPRGPAQTAGKSDAAPRDSGH